MPGHVVNAVQFTHASASQGVSDDIARYIAKPDASLICSEKKERRDAVMKANAVLKNAKNLPQKKDRPKRSSSTRASS